MTHDAVPSVMLSSGKLMPKLGLGTWRVKDGAIVKQAYELGYHHFDGAAVYENEVQLGEAIRSFDRSTIFITSKLWSTEHHRVKEACQRSLKDWGLSFFDLYLVHWPVAFHSSAPNVSQRDSKGMPLIDHSISIDETWKQMESLVDIGLARSIGVCNFNIPRMQRLLENCRIKPAVNQVECHPYLKQTKLRAFCRFHGIQVVAYGPLGGGCAPVLDDPTVNAVAKESEQSPAQVCLAWAAGHNLVVIPKAGSVEHMKENLHFKPLSSDQLKVLDTIGKDDWRYCDSLSLFGVDVFSE